MPNPVSSHAVTEKMKTYCAMFGRPDEIMTGGGPQYTGNSRRVGASVTQLAQLTTQRATDLPKDVRRIKPIIRKTIRNVEDIP